MKSPLSSLEVAAKLEDELKDEAELTDRSSPELVPLLELELEAALAKARLRAEGSKAALGTVVPGLGVACRQAYGHSDHGQQICGWVSDEGSDPEVAEGDSPAADHGRPFVALPGFHPDDMGKHASAESATQRRPKEGLTSQSPLGSDAGGRGSASNKLVDDDTGTLSEADALAKAGPPKLVEGGDPDGRVEQL